MSPSCATAKSSPSGFRALGVHQGLDQELIAREKAQSVKKSGLLEIIEPQETLDSIGGLDNLKTWLQKRRRAFSKEAVAYGLPSPKGVLILGGGRIAEEE